MARDARYALAGVLAHKLSCIRPIDKYSIISTLISYASSSLRLAVAPEASVVGLDCGYAAIQALLAPLTLPPPVVTNSVERLGFPAPFPPAYGLRGYALPAPSGA